MIEAIHLHANDPIAWDAYRDWLEECNQPWRLPEMVNSVGMHLALIKPSDVIASFYLGVFPVTQEEYQLVMGKNPSHFKGDYLPVEMVTWKDATAFCVTLSALPAEKAAGRVYRLPTEVEWEYACRAGTTTEYHSGDGEESLARVGWFYNNSDNTTHPVGEKEPNAFGLYDMHGNVWEWTSSLWEGEQSSDPQGLACSAAAAGSPTAGTAGQRTAHGSCRTPGPSISASGWPQDKGRYRVLRGGSWFNYGWNCRSAYRNGYVPDSRYQNFGFRVAFTLNLG